MSPIRTVNLRAPRIRVSAVPAGSAAVVVGPVGGAARVDGIVEDLVLVGRAAVVLPGAEQELVGAAAVAGSPGVAAALLRVADAHAERRLRGVAAAGQLRRRTSGRAGAGAGGGGGAGRVLMRAARGGQGAPPG